MIFAYIISYATLGIKHHSTFTDEKLEFKKTEQLIQCAVIPIANAGPMSSNFLFVSLDHIGLYFHIMCQKYIYNTAL